MLCDECLAALSKKFDAILAGLERKADAYAEVERALGVIPYPPEVNHDNEPRRS